jgi:membrane-associated phospholipid phosphatase
LGVGINELVERATGRKRPYQTRSSTAFLAGGRSFTSGDIVIESALAAGVSAYYQHEWYVAVPLYSLVLLEGFTLIGNNTQWFSDVAGGGLLGFTTAEALLWLHRRQALEPDRWRIFPIATPVAPARGKVSTTPSVGLAIAYSW